MSMAMEGIRALFGSAESSLLAVGVMLSLAWQSLGLANSRQWFLLPVAVGLTGLAAFLLNPLADATSLVDLQQSLMAGNGLVTLCAIQFTFAATSFWLGIRSAGSDRPEPWELLLGILHSIPVGTVLLGMLFIEQQWLARQIGARPEWVGLSVAVGVGLLLLLITLMLALLPRRLIRKSHLFSALWLAALAALLTSFDRSLPSVPTEIRSPEMMASNLVGLLVGGVCLAIGFTFERLRSRTDTQNAPLPGTRLELVHSPRSNRK
jgi:hypothetical protein